MVAETGIKQNLSLVRRCMGSEINRNVTHCHLLACDIKGNNYYAVCTSGISIAQNLYQHLTYQVNLILYRSLRPLRRKYIIKTLKREVDQDCLCQ